MGFLRVSISPAAAIADGAQWHLRPIEEWPNPEVWHNSGETVSYPAGTYTLVFKSIPGWNVPVSKTGTISAGKTLITSGSYNLAVTPTPTVTPSPTASPTATPTPVPPGYLKVTIYPSQAVSVGAQWRLRPVGSDPNPTIWNHSGQMVAYPPGTYTLVFKPLEGWNSPNEVTGIINSGSSLSTYGLYSSQ